MAQKSFTTNFLITQGLLIRDEPDRFNTARYCLKRNYLRAFFIFILVTVFQHGSLLAQTRSDNKEPLYLSSAQSSQNTFWKDIDTHWGGRFKTTGTGSQVTDDTIFAPVGTGNYYDGSANLRLINETFFTDSLFFEVDYELIWAGGDTVRKQNELKDIFPNLFSGVFFLGAPLDDDRRLMDLTHTIKEENSWFLLQRLDRL